MTKPSRGLRHLALHVLATASVTLFICFNGSAQNRSIPVNKTTLVTILRAEDQRRWDGALRSLLQDRNPAVRRRAALAAGRIGDEQSVNDLASVLQGDPDVSVRSMAAFALGEIESISGTTSLLATLNENRHPDLQARTIE